MNFRSVYVAYQNDPCGSTEFFQRQIEKLLDRQDKLSVIRIQVQGLIELAKRQPNEGEKLIALFKDIVDSLRGPVVGEAAARKLPSPGKWPKLG